MDPIATLKKRLRELAKELATIAEQLGEENDFPQAAVERMREGKCLNCDRTPEEISVVRRGLCAACYQKVIRGLKFAPSREAELIAKGVLAPYGFTLREPGTALDSFIDEISQESNQPKATGGSKASSGTKPRAETHQPTQKKTTRAQKPSRPSK